MAMGKWIKMDERERGGNHSPLDALTLIFLLMMVAWEGYSFSPPLVISSPLISSSTHMRV